MVAVVTELMVGGETPPKMIRQRDPLGLWSLNSDSEGCPSNGKDIFVLDNISALIDEYICADFLLPQLFPCNHAADHTYKWKVPDWKSVNTRAFPGTHQELAALEK
jgi:hypothetical protein